ncbi:TolC family protein [Candidatus Avelusimicrobium fimicolum]|uniref:TolC family protein n=1 Tax=Candidatus Avelusimicrobium fimicolum TaxID=3416216 RepID=UPI003D0ABE1E
MKKWVLLALMAAYASACLGAAPGKAANNLFAEREEVGGEKITISDAIRMALSDSYQIIDAQKTKEIYEQQLSQSRSGYYPSLSLDGSYSRALKKGKIIMGAQSIEIGQNNTYQAGLNASYVLWAGGQIRNSVNLAKVGAEQGLFNLRHVQDVVTKQVVGFCYDIIYAAALIRVQEEYLDIAKQHLEEAQAKYKQGLASSLDVLTQKVKVENIEPTVLQAQKNFELGNLYLRQILNRDPEDRIYLTWTQKDLELPQTPSLDELYNLAMEKRPELKLSKLAVDAAHYNVKIARSGHMPVLALNGNYTYNGVTDNGFPQHKQDYYWSSAAGVTLSVPLFEGFKVSSQVAQKELAYEQAVAAYQNKMKNVRIQVKEAWLNLEEARSRIEATKGVVEQARENLNSQMKRYRAGLTSQLEVNDAISNVNDSDLKYVQAVYDGAIALSDLKFAVGVEVNLYEKKN